MIVFESSWEGNTRITKKWIDKQWHAAESLINSFATKSSMLLVTTPVTSSFGDSVTTRRINRMFETVNS